MDRAPDLEVLRPEDVYVSAETLRGAFTPLQDEDWSVPAGSLVWPCREVLEHIIDALDVYAVSLARRGPVFSPAFRNTRDPDLPVRKILRILVSRAAVLAEVAKAAPPDARAMHATGVADRSGWVGMGCVEVLVHSVDIARGLGTTFDAPPDVVGRVVRRVFPWAPTDVEPWDALMWATGRKQLAGEPDMNNRWVWWCRPLDEWDGELKDVDTLEPPEIPTR